MAARTVGVLLLCGVLCMPAVWCDGAEGPVEPHNALRAKLLSNLESYQMDGKNIVPTEHDCEHGRCTQESSRRPLTIFYTYNIHSSRSQADSTYLREKLMPATAAFLGRSFRLARAMTGRLNILQPFDCDGERINLPAGGVDADLVIKVVAEPLDSEICQNGRTLAAAAACLQDNTGRPVYGGIYFCTVDPTNFRADLETAVHEIMHVLGFDEQLFPFFGQETVTQQFRERGATVTKVVTPTVINKVREQFGCPTLNGAELEDDGGPGTAGSHWEQRIFDGEMMDGVSSGGGAHHNWHTLTPVTLALFADSGWYQVDYTTAGINSYGMNAGCEFALGDFAAASAQTRSARFLCPRQQEGRVGCLYDHTAPGVCVTDSTWDGFYRKVTGAQIEDCIATRNNRCLELSNGQLACAEIYCAADDTVLIAAGNNNITCENANVNCPADADDIFCGKNGGPGYATCRDLQDCSGRGDCRRGQCYCFPGFGGDDCS